MNNGDILKIAMAQSATDLNCDPSDFLGDKNRIVVSEVNAGARKYLKLPFSCNLVSYGNGVVASVSQWAYPAVEKYLGAFSAEHCFETPNLHVLDDWLRPHGARLCFMAEYFLPDTDMLKERQCGFAVKILEPAEFSRLYTPEWSNALCKDRKELDVLAVGAYDGEKLVGLAGCSADCENMWQIGIDVLPEYRRRGIASALTSKIAVETLSRGKVPFYCAAWSNLKSVKNALKCGFRPAWTELTAADISIVEKFNKSIIL